MSKNYTFSCIVWENFDWKWISLCLCWPRVLPTCRPRVLRTCWRPIHEPWRSSICCSLVFCTVVLGRLQWTCESVSSYLIMNLTLQSLVGQTLCSSSSVCRLLSADMCSGKCSRLVAYTLYPLILLSICCNIVLFFPDLDVKYAKEGHITEEVKYLGGVVGGGLMVSLLSNVFIHLWWKIHRVQFKQKAFKILYKENK